MHDSCFLWSHPRSCGTALELFLEAQGFFDSVKVNPFDADYYFLRKKGLLPPKIDGEISITKDSFEVIADKLLQERKWLVRSAGYIVLDYVKDENDKLKRLLLSTKNIILVRDPAYSLVTHRQLVEKEGGELSFEECGYEAQWELAQFLQRINADFLVLDTTFCLEDLSVLKKLFPDLNNQVTWDMGMRQRWGMWSDWKQEVSATKGLHAMEVNIEREEEGKKDPFYSQCFEFYQRLLELDCWS
jgi:hypothetical protein